MTMLTKFIQIKSKIFDPAGHFWPISQHHLDSWHARGFDWASHVLYYYTVSYHITLLHPSTL